MSRSQGVLRVLTDGRLAFFCPACQSAHVVRVGEGGYRFNGDFERPTFSPSIRVDRCHSDVVDGRIAFYRDCAHEMRGQVAGLEFFP